ncbi:hypothetical protein ACLOJK_021462 [Asimina triloba]
MAASSVELQNTVKEALNALYHHPDDSVRMQADQWLQNFQRTIDAWQVQRDFEELPSEAFGPLRDSLYICIAVAALAVHVSAEDWGGGGVLNWLKDEMSLHPEWIRSFLELLTVLPQEAFSYRIAARRERRRQFERELASSSEVALRLLTACLGHSELTEQAVGCMQLILVVETNCSQDIGQIPASTLASHSLVFAALSGLNSEQLLEASVNVVSELIHYTVAERSGGLSAQMPLVQVLVPRVMSLREQLNDSSKDEEDIKAMARLFADVGESYVELIATGSDESMLIVQALLGVASHPEYDIASMTYNFWHSLQVNLTGWEYYASYGSEAAIEAERSRRLQIFCPVFELLVSFRAQYPADYQNFSKEDMKDFKQTRIGNAYLLNGWPSDQVGVSMVPLAQSRQYFDIKPRSPGLLQDVNLVLHRHVLKRNHCWQLIWQGKESNSTKVDGTIQ